MKNSFHLHPIVVRFVACDLVVSGGMSRRRVQIVLPQRKHVKQVGLLISIKICRLRKRFQIAKCYNVTHSACDWFNQRRHSGHFCEAT